MPTNDDPLLLDTSAAMHYADPESPSHGAVRAAAKGRRIGLAGHAAFELFSVLTRLPAPKRLSGGAASRLIERDFPDSRFLDPVTSQALVADFAAAGIGGGAVHDALVAAAARHHGLTLLTCDTRARAAYDAMKVRYQLIN